MRRFTGMTIQQRMEIHGVLENDGYTSDEVSRYEAHIIAIAKTINNSVYFVWQTQRKYAMATVRDLISSLTQKGKI